MTLKQEAIALIESIPDERQDVLQKIVKGIYGLLDADSQDDLYNDTEQDLALIEDAESLTHDENSAPVTDGLNPAAHGRAAAAPCRMDCGKSG